MDIPDGDPSNSSYGHLSIAQKYPREYKKESKGGYFTIPYGFKATPLSSYDFTIDQRDKIYLKENDKVDIPVAILFYDEFFIQDKDLLDNSRSMFLNSSNTYSMAFFRFCNLSIETVLAEEFKRIREDKTHPFNLILSPSNSSIFILVYKKGYPQCIYEGPVNTESFSEFLTSFNKDLEKIKKNPGSVKEQLWISYNKLEPGKKGSLDKKYLEAFSEAPELVKAITVKPAPWPRGRMEHTKTKFIDGKKNISYDPKQGGANTLINIDYTNNATSPEWKEVLFKYYNKFGTKMAEDRNNKKDLSALYIYDGSYKDSKTDNNKQIKDFDVKILTAIFTSRYNDFYLPPINKNQQNNQQNKGGGGDAVILNNSLMVYGLITELLYQNKYSVTPYLPDNNKEEAIQIAVDYYGCYLYKKDENLNTEEDASLRGMFITEGLPAKYSDRISKYITENDSLVLKVLKDYLKNPINNFNNNTKDDEDKVNMDEVLDVVKTNIKENLEEVYENNPDNASKNKYPLVKYINEDGTYKIDEEFNDEDYEFKYILEFLNTDKNVSEVQRKNLYICTSDPKKCKAIANQPQPQQQGRRN